MDFFEFERLFKAALAKLRLPRDVLLQEPEVETIAPPLSWTVEFFIAFPDGMHIRIWESYDKIAGLYASRRAQWAYHYGSPQKKDASRKLIQGDPNDPVMIRIDTCSGLHLHYQSRNPHHSQAQIQGLKLADVDCWLFIRNILKYRQGSQSIPAIFGFKI